MKVCIVGGGIGGMIHHHLDVMMLRDVLVNQGITVVPFSDISNIRKPQNRDMLFKITCPVLAIAALTVNGGIKPQNKHGPVKKGHRGKIKKW